MTEYTAIAAREDDLWVVQIPGIGVTQGVSREDAHHMARDYIAVTQDIPIDQVTVNITFAEPIDTAALREALVDRALEVLRALWDYRSVEQMDPDGVQREHMGKVVDAVSAEWTEQLTDLFVRYDRLRDDMTGIYVWARDHLGLEHDASTLDVTSLITRFEADSVAYRKLIASANPDLTAAVARAVRLNIHAGSTDFGIARAAIQAVFRHYETPYSDPEHVGSNLLAMYLDLARDFNRRIEPRCQVFACDHRISWHGDLGCELCSCPNLLPPKRNESTQ